jgi:hypothetical protein
MGGSPPSLALAPRPRPISRRGWVLVAVIAVLLTSAFLLVVRFYDAEGGITVAGGVHSADSGIVVTLEPVSVDAQRNTATVHLSFTPQGSDLADGQGRMLANTRILILSTNGTDEIKVSAGEPMGQKEVLVGLAGEPASYPFDSYKGLVEIIADNYVKNSDGSISSTNPVRAGINGYGGVNGWDTAVGATPGLTISPAATIAFDRAFSTQAFALLLLALAVMLALVAIVVAILVRTNRRRAEVALMSWTASLLFALPLLRSFMPNAPPIGASIDIFVYLWVIATAIVAALLVVLAWVQQQAVMLDASSPIPDVGSGGQSEPDQLS